MCRSLGPRFEWRAVTRPFLFTLPITTISLPPHERVDVLPLNLELRRVLSRRAHTSSACSAVTLPEKAALTLGDLDLGAIGLFDGLLCGLRGRPSLFSRWSSSMRVPWRMAGRRLDADLRSPTTLGVGYTRRRGEADGAVHSEVPISLPIGTFRTAVIN